MKATKRTSNSTATEITFFQRMLAYCTSACFADCVSFPMDVAKVRLQVQGENKMSNSGSPVIYRGLFGTIRTIAREEGIRSLYKGLPAGSMRQLCFVPVRFGFYEPLKEFYKNLFYGYESDIGLNIPIRIAAGLTSGSMSVLVGQHADVVKVRLQATVKSKDSQRYVSVRDAYKKIYKTEGILGFWKGAIPNAARSGIITVAEIVVYDTAKDLLIGSKLMKDNIVGHFTCACTAGFTAALIASPVDVVKTRYMNSPKGTYRNAIICAIATYKKEGGSAFYKGVFPSFCRIVSWNIIHWTTFEQLRRIILHFQSQR